MRGRRMSRRSSSSISSRELNTRNQSCASGSPIRKRWNFRLRAETWLKTPSNISLKRLPIFAISSHVPRRGSTSS